MKFNMLLPTYLALICCVHAFKAGGPIRVQIQKAGSQRPPWINMSDKNAAISADLKKKRSITVQFVQETPGGYICDVGVKNLRASTSHRIVMSKENLKQFSELAGKQVEVPALCMYIMRYMIDKGMKLDNTEGMIDASVFPVNYFTLKQLTYFHEDVEDKIVELCKQAPDLSEW